MPLWYPKNGRPIDVRDMTDKHLCAARALVEEFYHATTAEGAAAAAYGGSGEMAGYYADQCASQAQEKAEHWLYWMETFDLELSRRMRPSKLRTKRRVNHGECGEDGE